MTISGILMQYHILNAVDIYSLNVVNSILTKPVGGILFGVAFWMVARSLSDTKISDYMKLCDWNNVTFHLKSRCKYISSALSSIWSAHNYIHGPFILFVIHWDILFFNFYFYECPIEKDY